MTATLESEPTTAPGPEASERFACFGSHAAVYVLGSDTQRSAEQAVSEAKRRLRHWNQELSRFVADSELCRLNADPRERVPVSATMAHFVEAAIEAASCTGGLVDATLLTELEQAGTAATTASPCPSTSRSVSPRRVNRRTPTRPAAGGRCASTAMTERSAGHRA